MSGNEQQALGAVTQADRRAASIVLATWGGGAPNACRLIEAGEWDDHNLVELMRYHRLATPTDQVEADGDKALMPEAAVGEAFDMAHQLIQEAKGGAIEKDWAYVQNHLDDAEHWLDKAQSLTNPNAWTPPGFNLEQRESDDDCGCPEEYWDTPYGTLHMHLSAGKPSNACLDNGDQEWSVDLTAETVDYARAALFGWCITTALTTPTPVEELEKGAAGEALGDYPLDFVAEARAHADDMPACIQRDYLYAALNKIERAALTNRVQS